MNKVENSDRIENSIEILKRLKTNVAILKQIIWEEAKGSKLKSPRTMNFLARIYKYNEETLKLIDRELEILKLDKSFYDD